MDGWLSHYADLTEALLPNADRNAAGAGAAGGLGFALLSYLHATLVRGIDLVIAETHLEDALRDADLVVTGEGRLDGQSCMGKAPVGVASAAKKHGVPVIAFSGAVTPDAGAVNAYGIDAFFPILRTPCSLAEAMDVENAYRNLRDTAEQAIRLFVCAQKVHKHKEE
jgi:glycerate kinase